MVVVVNYVCGHKFAMYWQYVSIIFTVPPKINTTASNRWARVSIVIDITAFCANEEIRMLKGVTLSMPGTHCY